MPKKKYVIELTNTERRVLMRTIKNGTSPAKVITRANILLASDASKGKPPTVAEVVKRYNTTLTTVQNVRTAYANSGLEGALYRKKRETPPIQPKVDGNLEAHIIAISCSDPPEGYER